MKSIKSEDLSKDFQINLRIYPPDRKDFMMNKMNRQKMREFDLRPVIMYNAI